MSQNLRRTPLYNLSSAQKARFTPFSGWEMPVQYQGLKQEHLAVRNAVGMFDISHMGKFLLTGENLRQELNYLIPSDISELKPGEAQYSVLLNQEAGILDDIIFYYQGKNNQGLETGVIIVNAATTSKDKAWLLKHLDSNQVKLEDVTEEQVLIALQGPLAVDKLESIVGGNLAEIPLFGHITTKLGDDEVFIARTGYTGEDGFEIMLPSTAGQELWRSLLKLDVTPCGLGSRDTLRLEAAMALYGQDIDETTTPLEAGLKWLIDLDKKTDFIGKESLVKQSSVGVKRRLVGLTMQGKQIARHDYPIVSEGKIVSKVTSGTLSPTLNQAIALAYLPTSVSQVGQEVEVEIRGKLYPATVVKKPFYRSKTRSKVKKLN